MTSETLSNQSSDKFINIKLLKNNIRQNKSLIIITGILLFFARPFVQIVSLMIYYNANTGNQSLEWFAESSVQGFGLLIPLAAFVLAFVTALSVTGYMHGRKSAIFYGSIPITRKSLFFTQYLSGLVYFIPSFIVSYALAVLIMPYSEAVSLTTDYYLGALCFFVLIYSFVVLCANISGTFLNTVFTAVYLCAVLPAVFFTGLSCFDIFYRFTGVYGMTDSSFWQFVFYPVLTFFPVVFGAERLEVIDCVLMIVFSAGLIVFAYFFNRLTKTENAENPFYFTKFLAVFKYSALAVMVIYAGMMFYAASGYNFLFFIIGTAAGGFLAFMFLNFIIYKNIREIFKGIKQFFIFCVCASVFAGFVFIDLLGIDRHIPDASRVASVEYDIWNSNFNFDFSYDNPYVPDMRYYYFPKTITITDQKTVELMNNIFTSAHKSGRIPPGGVYEERLYDIDFIYNPIYYYLKNGGFWAKKLNSYELYFSDEQDLTAYRDAVAAYTESSGYRQALYYPLTDADFMREQLEYCEMFSITLKRSESTMVSRDISRGEMEDLVKILNEDLKTADLTNRGRFYDLTLFFRSPDKSGGTGYITIMFDTGDFERTIEFIYDTLG